MTKNKFTTKQIEVIVKKVSKKFNLTPQYIMSTSGEFFVKTYVVNKKTYLLKIRKLKSPKNKQRFIKEININHLLSKKNIPYLETPKFIESNTKLKPEYLLYELINGTPLNTYYFYLGTRRTQNLLNSHFLEIIQNIQKIKPTKKLGLKKFYFQNNYNEYLKYEKYLKKYLSTKNLRRIKKALQLNKHYLNNCDLVITHGDLNPKNLILKNNKLAIIDWSDTHLNNPLFDLCSLYMYSWNIPEVEKNIKKYINEKYQNIENVDKLYLINRIISTPKIIKITEDSIKGLKLDKKNKIILPTTEKKLERKAEKAIKTHIESLLDIIEHFELWQKPIPVIKSIDKFCNTIFIKKFLHQEKDNLNININYNDLSVKRLRLTIRPGDQKLISQYTLTDKNKRKIIIMAKIRMERGDDLAKQSYQTIKAIWNNKKNKHMISKPLNYYKKYNLYLYNKTIGDSISLLIENKKINKNTLKKHVKQAGETMSELHNIDITNFSKIKFIDNYGTDEQLKWFKFYLNKIPQLDTKKNHSLPKKTKNLIDKYLNNNQKTFVHGDFQLQNLIVHKNKIKLIDFDNSDINDPLLDVGNFLNQLNYKGLLKEGVDDLRKIFLKSYLKNNPKLSKINFNERLNIYIIMGIIKNINFNCLSGDFVIAKHDIKKLFFLIKNLSKNPLVNLKSIKKFIH